MAQKEQLTQNEENLIRRYLIWCYKTTKEKLDKIDRYFTQLIADDFILQQLEKTENYKPSTGQNSYKDHINQFQAYMKTKEANVLKKKFKDSKTSELDSEYFYLQKRFEGIEQAILNFLGEQELEKIRLLYEQEMTRRILEAHEHD